MSFIRRHTRLLLVAVSCVALGAAASVVATAGAASSGAGQTTAGTKATPLRGGKRGLGVQRLRRIAMRAVHGTVVVRTKSGFANVTFDRGKVDSISGRQLTITEGTRDASYRTVTLTIPEGATVRDDRRPAGLSSVKAGQRVLVVMAPSRTYVIARTPKSA